MTVAPGNANAPTPIQTPFIPAEGPRDLPITFDFASTVSYDLDLQAQVQNAQFSRAQTIFIDNSQNNGPVSVQWQGTGHFIQIPPGWQGFTPVLAVQRPRASVGSTGSGKTTIHVLNVPIAPCMWPTTQTTPNFNGAGALIVSDATLDAIASASGLQTIARKVGSGDVVYNEYKSQNAIAGLTTGPVASLLVGAPGFFVNFADIRISGDASLGAQTIAPTTFNGADKGGSVALSGGNLIALPSVGGSAGGVRSIKSFSTGKIYFEETLNWSGAGDFTHVAFGIASAAFDVTAQTEPKNNSNGMFSEINSVIFAQTVSVGSSGGGVLVNGDVVGTAIDADAGLFWQRKNAGTWNASASADPATGTLGLAIPAGIVKPYFALACVGSNASAGVHANFGGSVFNTTAPAGFGTLATTSGGSQGMTITLNDGTNVISEGYIFVNGTALATTTGLQLGDTVIKLDQLNYDSKVATSTLSLGVVAGGQNATLASGKIVYNIGAGTTAKVN